jgi:hypothetical protein
MEKPANGVGLEEIGGERNVGVGGRKGCGGHDWGRDGPAVRVFTGLVGFIPHVKNMDGRDSLPSTIRWLRG